MEGDPLLDGLTLAMVRSTLGVVFGSVGPDGLFPRYSSNIAAISNLMEDLKVSKDAKCSSLEIRELTRIGGGVAQEGVSLFVSSSPLGLTLSPKSDILLGG
jgi:hypothetical protein